MNLMENYSKKGLCNGADGALSALPKTGGVRKTSRNRGGSLRGGVSGFKWRRKYFQNFFEKRLTARGIAAPIDLFPS
jgi:hypothetical protein